MLLPLNATDAEPQRLRGFVSPRQPICALDLHPFPCNSNEMYQQVSLHHQVMHLDYQRMHSRRATSKHRSVTMLSVKTNSSIPGCTFPLATPASMLSSKLYASLSFEDASDKSTVQPPYIAPNSSSPCCHKVEPKPASERISYKKGRSVRSGACFYEGWYSVSS
mmetsp:Transcript_22806/g.34539  ORF Transcript_22806/g.34539 Transcript_22806/m.34539 type:complete len:164 (-) Transcript_22806:2897-3388(-)